MFLDTSGLLCFHHKSEPHHEDAVKFFRDAPRRLTHNYVIAEFVALAQARRLPRREALAFVSDLEDNPLVEMVWVEKNLHESALNLLRQQLDKSRSLCDAVGFLLMRQRNLTEALTTDHHFEQAGFVRLLKPN